MTQEINYGELVIKTVAMPPDTNTNGNVFGGWLLGQMDMGGGVLARSISPTGKVVTVAVDNVEFLQPVKVGNALSCYAEIIRRGRTSIQIHLTIVSYCLIEKITKLAVKGVFTYVAVDSSGKPIPLGISASNF